jgi:hypothetical protein
MVSRVPMQPPAHLSILEPIHQKSVMDQSKLLDSIGTAQMERELQSLVLTVAKKASDIMTEKTGVETSMNEDDIKNYMELVMRERYMVSNIPEDYEVSVMIAIGYQDTVPCVT